jgi:hypothetical protein
MYLLSRLFLFLAQSSERFAKERADSAYVAEATDLYDLEHRMRATAGDAAPHSLWWHTAR